MAWFFMVRYAMYYMTFFTFTDFRTIDYLLQVIGQNPSISHKVIRPPKGGHVKSILTNCTVLHFNESGLA